MTPHNRRASSARIAPAQSEPDVALTVVWPTRPVILSRGSLSPHCQIFNRRRLSVSFAATRASKVSLARSERQGLERDSVSMRPMQPALPNVRSSGQESPLAAINPGEAAGITATFRTGLAGQRGGRRCGAADLAG
jgi:hypothetical protein